MFYIHACLYSEQMDKSYEKLSSGLQPNAVATAVANLRRHNSRKNRDCICSVCGNNEENRFQVSDVDNATGSITEVKCKDCKRTSYVCRCQCHCHRSPAPTGLEFSYKEKLQNRPVQHSWKSIHICSVMDATIILLRRRTNGNMVCACGNSDPNKLKTLSVDQIGFIVGVQCLECQQKLAFSPLEESYVVQMLYHEQSDQEAVMQKALNGDHVGHIDEVYSLLRRHSFYEDSICPEFDSNDKECFRVTAINKTSGEVTEVEFEFKKRSHKLQRLQITCRSDCHYHQYSSRSQYETSYKEEMRKHLNREIERREATNEIRLKEAILSCTVLAANATILRRHNTDNKLCHNCNNDDPNFLKVTEIDKCGFITRVECTKCTQSMSTACHHSRFHYEEIDETMSLVRGDHISWHRNLAYWHHAIVTRTDGNKITVAHYASDGCSVTFQESTKNRRDVSTSVRYGTPYRITYEDCYTNEYSVLRAEKLVGEKHYNIFHRNCEHSSNWCKTGLSKSDQVVTCFSSLGKSLLSFGLRLLNVILLLIFQVIHEKREGVQIDRKAFEYYEHIVTSAYMVVVFLLFLVWSMYTECRKLRPNSDKILCCRRPPGVACGLSIRIIVREVFAALGPFLLIWFEDRFLPRDNLSRAFAVVFFALLGVTLGSYVFGAVLGTFLECICKHRICRRALCFPCRS